MIFIASLIFAAYSAYMGWPWWGAAIAGAVAGIWNFGVRAGGMPHLMDRSEQAGAILRHGTAVSVAIFGALALGVYFIVRLIAG